MLGFGSFFMDTSSETIHSLLPVFMVTVLGASAVSVGLIEGAAEGIGAITRVFSGALSDYFRNRKTPLVLGYALAALTKPLFPMAAGLVPVFTARFLDRIGKGVRGAPRDALVGDWTPSHVRGAAYGLRQTLDAFGATAGPLLALGLMALFLGDIRAVFWVAVIPAFISVALLWRGVEEPAHKEEQAKGKRPRFRDWDRLGRAFWWVAAVGGALTLARFSEAFLVLRAGNAGLPLAHIPLVLVVMSLVYALSAYPGGALMDRFGFKPVLASSLGALLLANLVLALAATPAIALLGAAMWG
ncbi:MAG TPA: MFS transporter, partial [Sphingomonadales bacterium]|nr:MFS transporter [Sphingomonadales bacterium]